jgi:hypothetical protein
MTERNYTMKIACTRLNGQIAYRFAQSEKEQLESTTRREPLSAFSLKYEADPQRDMNLWDDVRGVVARFGFLLNTSERCGKWYTPGEFARVILMQTSLAESDYSIVILRKAEEAIQEDIRRERGQ